MTTEHRNGDFVQPTKQHGDVLKPKDSFASMHTVVQKDKHESFRPETLNESGGSYGTNRPGKRPYAEDGIFPVAVDVRPAKRARSSGSLVTSSQQPLTRRNLREHTRMASNTRRGSKRGSKLSTSSGRDLDSLTQSRSTEQEASSQMSQKSSFSNARYRLEVLANANIIFRFHSVPQHIHVRINSIVRRKPSTERVSEIANIGKAFHCEFVKILSVAAREDDCIELINQALFKMDKEKRFSFPRKAEWQLTIRPPVVSRTLSFNFAFKSQEEEDHTRFRSNKRQLEGEPYLSPGTSGSAAADGMNPRNKYHRSESSAPAPFSQPGVKVPCPDISIGFRASLLGERLKLLGLTNQATELLFRSLANPDSRNGIRFPFLVVEGKSYATNKNIYEAQNQAAVSGACSIQNLHDLDDLARKAIVQNCNAPHDQQGKELELELEQKQPIHFSICTQGPIHELWAHYATMESGSRKYNMFLVKACNMGISDDVCGFLEAVDNVMTWAVDEHLAKIVSKLMEVAAAALSHG